VALLAAVVILLAADVTFAAAVETVRAAAAVVGAVTMRARLAVLRARLAVLRARLAVLRARLAVVRGRLAVLRDRLLVLRDRVVAARDRLAAVDVVLALVRGRLAAFRAVVPPRVRARFAEPPRAAVRVVVVAGIDLPPVVIKYGRAIPPLAVSNPGKALDQGERARGGTGRLRCLLVNARLCHRRCAAYVRPSGAANILTNFRPGGQANGHRAGCRADCCP
jgi:hypothetical protein